MNQTQPEPEFTREQFAQAIAEEQLGEGAQPVNKPLPEQIKETIQRVESQPASEEIFKVDNSQESQVTETPAESQTLSLGQAFEISEQQQQQYPQYSEQQIQHMIDARIAQLAQQNQKPGQTEEQATEQIKENLTPQQVAQIVQDALANNQRQQQQAYLIQQTVNAYEENLYTKLKNAQVDIDNDPVLQDWVTMTYSDAINKVRNARGRELYPDEIKEVSNWHINQVEQKLNLRKPQAQTAPKQNLSPINSGTPANNQGTKSQATGTMQRLEQEALQIANKQGGQLRPSQATKLARAVMKAQGVNKIRF